MLQGLKNQLSAALAARIRQRFDVDHEPVVQVPPRRALGDLASPAPLHLARTLRQKPRDIAEALLEDLELPSWVREARVEGAGYVNVFLDRSRITAAMLGGGTLDLDEKASARAESPKVIVEHTNINPNKAAHIGHLRNAVLGDVLIRGLRHLGHPVEVQNYIDDTGVQVADVVVGFIDIRGLSIAEVAAIEEPFDYVCWDLYSEVGRWYEEDPAHKERRRETLHQLESGEGPRAEMGRMIAERVVERHLATMARLGIDYDLLTRESDILGLDFFAVAFEKLKASGAVQLETDGKNEGCWVMPLSQASEFAGLEDPDKVIVRSDGTVTYVGKDIAYQLWKFGLLGRDFQYRPWEHTVPGDTLWRTTSEGGHDEHPVFGGGHEVINVIDARQSYLQRIVRAGLQALGHGPEAERSVHFAYEMVSLSKATARQLGFLKDDGHEGALEMSGRKGIGVKADDLLDQLEAKCRESVAARYDDLDESALDQLAHDIAIAALRFFMIKATTTRVIAFDLDDALSFEGETGPYLQYSLVREGNIRRKLEGSGEASHVDAATVASLPAEVWADDLWDLVLSAAQMPETVERAVSSLELSLLARAALDLAGKFHAVYHHHRIFGEPDESLRHVRLATNQVFRQALVELTDLLGVPVLDKM